MVAFWNPRRTRTDVASLKLLLANMIDEWCETEWVSYRSHDSSDSLNVLLY